MYVPVPALPTQLTKVKTEVSFRAENPWNDNRRGTFHLDNYVVTLRGANAVVDGAYEGPWPGGYHRALRSEADGISRFLPESLIELWLTKQAPTEALPGLLKQMESNLKKSDFKPMLRSMKIKVLIIVEMILCAALVTIAIVAAVLAQAPWWVAAAVVLGTAGVCWAFLYLLYFGKLFRRKRQMRWLLDRIQADFAFPASQPDLPATPRAKPQGRWSHAGIFVSSLALAHTDPFVVLSKLRAAFPELAWEGGEGVFGKIHLAGESRDGPLTIGVHLLCKEPPGPFTLSIRLEPAGAEASYEADALKARLVKALDLTAAPQAGHSEALASSMEKPAIPGPRANPPDKTGHAKGTRIGIITPRRDAPATAPRVKKPYLTSGPPGLSQQKPKVELWTSTRLHPGDQVEQYVLTRQMARDENIGNVETWLATDGAMGDVVLKIYWVLVGDDYGGTTDLGPYVSSLLPELDKTVAMPRISGVAPWVRYHYREQDRRLVMCRRAYPDRMLDRFPTTGLSGPYPDPSLLEVLGQIAEGIDHLTGLGPLRGPPLTVSVSTNNLLMESALACIVDFAPVLWAISSRIAEIYGPRLILRRDSSFCLPELYYFLRTGMKTRKDATGAKCVNGLIDETERDLVARALSSHSPEYSCKEFVKKLTLAAL